MYEPTIQKRNRDKAPHKDWNYVDTIHATLVECWIDGRDNRFLRVNQHGQVHDYEVNSKLYANVHEHFVPGQLLKMDVRADDTVKAVVLEGE